MAQDSTAMGLGIPYLILIFLTWSTAGSIMSTPPYFWIYSNIGGLLALIGCLFLIPVFILTIIYITGADSTCGTGAFYLALPAWILVITGSIVSLSIENSLLFAPLMLIVFICPQIILGFGLFARRNYTPTIRHRTLPSQPYYHPYYPQAATNRSLHPPPRYRRGNVVIPNQVRIASTTGQSIKRCVQCGNSLDIKTIICYFCGTRQPVASIRPSERRIPRYKVPTTSYSQPRNYWRATFSFCPNCGARAIQGALFCPSCGASLN